MDKRRIADEIAKLAKELAGGEIMGPGVPDGTGPWADTPQCPSRGRGRGKGRGRGTGRGVGLRRGPQDGTGPRGGTPLCPVDKDKTARLQTEQTTGVDVTVLVQVLDEGLSDNEIEDIAMEEVYNALIMNRELGKKGVHVQGMVKSKIR